MHYCLPIGQFVIQEDETVVMSDEYLFYVLFLFFVNSIYFHSLNVEKFF